MDHGEQTTKPADGFSIGVAERSALGLCVVYPPSTDATQPTLEHSRPLLVGRSAGTADFQVNDLKMSRAHFRIFWDGTLRAHRIQDMQSRNGTFLNGRPLTTAALTEDDVIRSGDSVFVYHAQPEALDSSARMNIARSAIPILLRGETGTGKERLAEELHALSGRDPFIAINCGEIAASLIASELFGHVRGAFSGAHSQKRGLVAAASGGTLFLDEIGELSHDLQPALLRVLEQGRVRPVGAESEISVDVRVISATNADLEAAMSDARFRPDLYARLAGYTIQATPLRHKRQDLLDIAKCISDEAGCALKLTADAAEALLIWDWPYNVRELKSLLCSHWAMASDEPLTLKHLKRLRPELATNLESARSSNPSSNPDEQELSNLLQTHGWNVSAVAKLTGRSRGSIYRWMQRVGIKPSR